jgi:acyl-CoA synthetase (AMP-forming)/AMP-acid ligase II
VLLAEILRKTGAEIPDRIAYVAADGWPVTYRELDQLSDEVAVGLLRRGVREGDVVGLAMPSNPDYIVAYGALDKIGACAAGVNPFLMARERRDALATATPRFVIATGPLTDGIPDGADVIEITEAGTAADIMRNVRVANEAPPMLPPDPDRKAAIVFTSGSTGLPKGALFRERTMRAVFDMDNSGSAGYSGTAHSVSATQWAHVGGMTKIPWMLSGGGTTHLMRKWHAQTVIEYTARYRMPALNAGPSQVALILRVPDLESYDLSCVKAIIAGMGPSSPGLIIEARQRIGCAYSVRYSSTESGGIGCATALDAPDEETFYTVGRPRPGVECMVVDEDGNELPDGETGEMALRHPGIFDEYYNNPEETARTLVDGWLRTGDLGTKDERGCFRVSGRIKEMFIRGGYKIYPVEVEKVLSEHPKVANIAVVPRPDPVMTEIGVAVVVPRDPANPPTLDELRDFAADKLARYKLPERIRYQDEIPMNSSYKMDRLTMKAREADEVHGG